MSDQYKRGYDEMKAWMRRYDHDLDQSWLESAIASREATAERIPYNDGGTQAVRDALSACKTSTAVDGPLRYKKRSLGTYTVMLADGTPIGTVEKLVMRYNVAPRAVTVTSWVARTTDGKRMPYSMPTRIGAAGCLREEWLATVKSGTL